MMIDINKTYRTRCGYEVRIYATNCGGTYPIHGAVWIKESRWQCFCWSVKGEAYIGGRNKYDLIEVKPRIVREVWVNLYPNQANGGYYPDKATADRFAESHRLACIMFPVDCEEGEGLE